VKKIIALLLAFIPVIAFAACGNQKGQDHLDAEVLEVKDSEIVAVCIRDSSGQLEGKTLAVSKNVISADGVPEIGVDDAIRVVFDSGKVRKSDDPVKMEHVYAIYLLEALEAVKTTETEAESEVLQYLTDRYGRKFTLWGPEGHDLYAFYIYPDHAEWECHILMPENTDDIAQYQKDLAWEVAGDELIISGAGSQEVFKIDVSAETATSTTTGRVYQIYEMEPPLE